MCIYKVVGRWVCSLVKLRVTRGGEYDGRSGKEVCRAKEVSNGVERQWEERVITAEKRIKVVDQTIY